jgi:hypothetical protein
MADMYVYYVRCRWESCEVRARQSGKRVLARRRLLLSLDTQTLAAHLRETHDDIRLGRKAFAIQMKRVDSR